MMFYDNFMSVQKKALTSVLWVSEIFVENMALFFFLFFSWLSHEDRWVRDPSAASFGCLPGKGGLIKPINFRTTTRECYKEHSADKKLWIKVHVAKLGKR